MGCRRCCMRNLNLTETIQDGMRCSWTRPTDSHLHTHRNHHQRTRRRTHKHRQPRHTRRARCSRLLNRTQRSSSHRTGHPGTAHTLQMHPSPAVHTRMCRSHCSYHDLHSSHQRRRTRRSRRRTSARRTRSSRRLQSVQSTHKRLTRRSSRDHCTWRSVHTTRRSLHRATPPRKMRSHCRGNAHCNDTLR